MTLRPQSALGAIFGTASAVPEFSSDSATLRERADIGCVLLTAADRSSDFAPAASQAAAVPLPVVPGEIATGASGAMKTSPSHMAIWLSPRSWLIQCDIEEEISLVERLNRTFPDKLLHAVGFTDHLCWFELSGTAAIDLITEGSFLSLERDGLPIGHAKRTLIAQIAAVIVRNGERTWLIAVERSRARYFADWLIATAKSPE
jgi:heterotetrameric sarcosine oxidase gamma subunit